MNEALVKKFAPVLFMHPEEKFVPVDAKRFVENASLWSVKGTFDDNTMWGDPAAGGSGRQPTIAAKGLAAVAGEEGTLIDDDTLLPAPGEETFLELGAWKDAAEAHEAGVTATSKNVYADRSAIAGLYAGDPLNGSRFWYHAEMFDGARLTRLVGEAGPPDFSRFVTANSALLCYYFFFPAHQQSVATDYCADLPVSAREAVCHVGDWQCMAILLEGDGTGDVAGYTPKYFGCTGSRHVPVGDQTFRPYSFDDDGYTVMNVERWRPNSGPAMALPALDTTHPRLFVALGTHGLYTAPGTYELEPFNGDTTSRWCGTFDTPGVMPPGWGQPKDTFAADAGAFLAKVLGGLGLGGALGGIAGPALAAAGIISAAAEGVIPEPGTGVSVVGTYDPPDPDQAPAAGAGLTIRPPGVSVSGAGIAVEEWQVEENVQIGNRTYNYLVDRDKQRWWPNDDREHGFRGRWGQRVTSDFLPRRSGPKFPDYLKMFLMALADGDARGLFKDE